MVEKEKAAGQLSAAIDAMKQQHCKPWNGEMHSVGACTICDVVYAREALPQSERHDGLPNTEFTRKYIGDWPGGNEPFPNEAERELIDAAATPNSGNRKI